ncbi:hypothetical protein [Pantoea sp. VS1]|uniref:hypothetical protein n=1 Tax=Pantoea sp. VS1 TaxID=2003658 RepID=UPI001596128E|nr:hypothetical protein [Pantoea sp. VS1]
MLLLTSLFFGNDEEQNQPNIGKDLSDADKAELGGTGPERLAVASHRMRKMHEIMKTVQIIILTVSRKMMLFRMRTIQLTNKVYLLRPEHGKNAQVDLVVFLNP